MVTPRAIGDMGNMNLVTRETMSIVERERRAVEAMSRERERERVERWKEGEVVYIDVVCGGRSQICVLLCYYK